MKATINFDCPRTVTNLKRKKSRICRRIASISSFYAKNADTIDANDDRELWELEAELSSINDMLRILSKQGVCIMIIIRLPVSSVEYEWGFD